MRGMGHSGVPMILSVIGTVGTRIVWVYLLFPHHRSLYFLFISYPASWILTIIMQAVCFYFVRKQCRMEMQDVYKRQDFEEAARIDGANSFQIFYKIYVPIMKPSLILVGVLNMLSAWNDYLGPLIFLQVVYKRQS